MKKTSSVVKDRYNKKAYDDVTLRVFKGEKQQIKDFAQSKGESMNAFIRRVVFEAIKQSDINLHKEKKHS